MFILAKGMVEIIKWDSFRVGVLVEGQYFGEMAILCSNAEEARRVSAGLSPGHCSFGNDAHCLPLYAFLPFHRPPPLRL